MKTTKKASPKSQSPASTLMVRLDQETKLLLKAAADLRKISVSDYVRALVITQARQDVEENQSHQIRMSPQGQAAFWSAVNTPAKLTPKQQTLGKLMRGES